MQLGNCSDYSDDHSPRRYAFKTHHNMHPVVASLPLNTVINSDFPVGTSSGAKAADGTSGRRGEALLVLCSIPQHGAPMVKQVQTLSLIVPKTQNSRDAW